MKQFNETTMTTRTATPQDFKIGTILINAAGNQFPIDSKYGEGMWETRGSNGKVVFENEAKFYKVAVK